MDTEPKTILCDIDGVLFQHFGDITKQHLGKPHVLDGVIDAIKEWDKKGYIIILLTGRRESVRRYTEAQLAESGIIYDRLIMGLPRGRRVVVNDRKEDSAVSTAEAYSLLRNEGLKSLKEI